MIIIRDTATRERAMEWIKSLAFGQQIFAKPYEEMRNGSQNALLHAVCTDIAKQVEWAGRKWDKEDWKRIMLAGKYGQEIVPNPLGDGVIVVNKKRSSEIPKRGEDSFSDFVEEITAWALEQDVKLHTTRVE